MGEDIVRKFWAEYQQKDILEQQKWLEERFRLLDDKAAVLKLLDAGLLKNGVVTQIYSFLSDLLEVCEISENDKSNI